MAAMAMSSEPTMLSSNGHEEVGLGRGPQEPEGHDVVERHHRGGAGGQHLGEDGPTALEGRHGRSDQHHVVTAGQAPLALAGRPRPVRPPHRAIDPSQRTQVLEGQGRRCGAGRARPT